MKHDMRLAASDKELPQFDSKPISDVLGDSMPKLNLTKSGRLRLVNALQYKFGENFRNFEKAHGALEHFDKEYEHTKTYLKLKGHIRG